MNYLDSYSTGMNAIPKVSSQNPKIETPQQTPQAPEKDTKKLKLALAGLAVAGAAAIGIAVAVKKGKSVDLSKINFDKGVASLKDNGQKYTGKIKDTLKNGDKIILKYENGILKQSSVKGSRDIQKLYSSVNGEKIVKIIENGKERVCNITQLANEGKEKAAAIAREKAKLAAENALQHKPAPNGKRPKTPKKPKPMRADDVIRPESPKQPTPMNADEIIHSGAQNPKKPAKADGVARPEAQTPKKPKKADDLLPPEGATPPKPMKAEDLMRPEAPTPAKPMKADDVLPPEALTPPKPAKAPAADKVKDAAANAGNTISPAVGKDVKVIDLAQDLQEKKADKCVFGFTFGKNPDMVRDLDEAQVLKFLEENKDLTPDQLADAFKSFKGAKYDIPDKFMIAVNNQVNKTGSALIVDEVPAMFKGIDPKEIQSTIEKLQLVADKNNVMQFTMGGKQYSMEYISGGQIGNVFKITDAKNQSVALKYFKNPLLTGTQGLYAEIPVARQASLEKVINVPKFYMANPSGMYVDTIQEQGLVKGGWQMVEYITPDMPLKQGGPKFSDWLQSKNLGFGDYNAGTQIGNYIVDVGGVIKVPQIKGQHLEDVNLALSSDASESMARGAFRFGETVTHWIETLKNRINKAG